MALLGACDSPTEELLSPERPLERTSVSTVGVPTVVGDDWQSYSNKTELKAADYFWWYRTGDVYQYVDLDTDPLFGKVVRTTFPQSDEVGLAPKMSVQFGKNLDKMWYRFKVKYSPGWTSAGPYPVGHANSYKLAFWHWESGYTGRGSIEISNTTQYIGGFGATDAAGRIVYTEKNLPGSAPDFGHVTTEWSDNEWWEYVVYYNRTGATSVDQHMWRRRYTQSGKAAPGAWVYVGYTATGRATPRVSGISLGETRNKSNPSTMHIWWGPWEVVDGSAHANPFGMPNVGGGGGTAPTPTPTLSGIVINPPTASVARNGTVQFQTTGRMSDGSTSSVAATYTATGGSISATGLYTAGATAGTFQVIVRESGSGHADTATVSITAAAASLSAVVLTPGNATVAAGGTVQFQASGRMSDGSTTAPQVTYAATGGSISSNGVYTAGKTAGAFRVIATEPATGLADTATVTISQAAATLTRVELTPATVSIASGKTVQFQGVGRMSDGSSSNIQLSFSATGGSISGSGLYTAGGSAGTFRVTATHAGSGLSASSTVTITAPPVVPPTGNYSTLVGDDWKGYSSTSALSGYYSASELSNVALVNDAVFGKVVRITQPGGSSVSPTLSAPLPGAQSRVWYRWRMKYSAGWTDRGTGSRTYEIAGFDWAQLSGFSRIQLVTGQYQIGLTARDASNNRVRYSERVLPGSASSLGTVSTEFQGNDWWEFVMLYEKTGSTSAKNHYWRRRLTQGNQLSAGPWVYHGFEISGAATPTVDGIELGGVKGGTTSTQHIYWGPWEVVDGNTYRNPFGMAGF